MPEVPHSGKHLRQTQPVGGVNDFLIRFEPPGWTTAVTPCLAISSTPSRNEKNVSSLKKMPTRPSQS